MISGTDPTNEFLIAPCGINCRLCYAYSREKNVCPGCRGDDAFKMKSCLMCKIKNCAKRVSGGFIYCFECETYPCELIKHLDKRYRTKYGTSPIANLHVILESGIQQHVENENKKWICPQCGAMLCMHKAQCLECGYGWME
jgi:hypothetical protein